MEWIKSYVITVIVAGIICGICVVLTGKNKTTGSIVKMICGIFMALTMIAPLVKVRLDDLGSYFESIKMDGESVAQAGKLQAATELSAVIKNELETYILDKAESMGLDLQVSVVLDGSTDPPVPVGVTLEGPVSAYHKRVLTRYISQYLGITEAQQTWNGRT